MAKLTENPYPMPRFKNFDSIREHHDAEQEAFNNIEEPIYQYPRADGKAYYRVVEIEDEDGEPVLQHIPFGDAYGLPDAHIRGLRTQDIRENIKRQEKLSDLFS